MTDADPGEYDITPPYVIGEQTHRAASRSAVFTKAASWALVACVSALLCFWAGTTYGKRSGRIALKEDPHEATEAR